MYLKQRNYIGYISTDKLEAIKLCKIMIMTFKLQMKRIL